MATMIACDCGRSLQVPVGARARKGKCPGCGRILRLEAAEPHTPDLILRCQAGCINSVAFARDGQTLVAGCDSLPDVEGAVRAGELHLWKLADGQSLAVAKAHRGGVTSVALDPDLQLVVTGGRDGTLVVWEIVQGMWDSVSVGKLRALEGHSGEVTGLGFSPSGGLVASAAKDQTVRLWDVPSWQPAGVLRSGRLGQASLSFSPDGRYLAGAWRSRGPVIIWDVATRKEATRLRLPSEQDFDDFAVGFGANSDTVVVMSSDEVRVWDLASMQVLVTLPTHRRQAMAVSGASGQLALGGKFDESRSAVSLHEIATGVELRKLEGHNLPVACLAWSCDGQRLATGSVDSSINVWTI